MENKSNFSFVIKCREEMRNYNSSASSLLPEILLFGIPQQRESIESYSRHECKWPAPL